MFGTNSAPPVETRGLQVVARSAAYSTSEALCTDVWLALCLIDNETIGSTRYLWPTRCSRRSLSTETTRTGCFTSNFLVTREVT